MAYTDEVKEEGLVEKLVHFERFVQHGAGAVAVLVEEELDGR